MGSDCFSHHQTPHPPDKLHQNQMETNLLNQSSKPIAEVDTDGVGSSGIETR